MLVQLIERVFASARPGASDAREEYHSDLTLAANYPFTDADTVTTAKDLLTRVPPPELVTQFVDVYLDTIQKTHGILQVTTFMSELNLFWEQPSKVTESWLAQFFAVLALGCQALSYQEPEQTDHAIRASQLLEAAELMLRKTPFLFRPNLTTIRVLCLMTVAKQTGAGLCYESDASWPLMGLLVRLAMSMGLHSESAILQNYKSPVDVDACRSLWTIILYMEVRQSMASGMPLLLSREDFTTLPPCNNGNNEKDDPTADSDLPGKTDLSIHIALYHAFGILARMLKQAQSEATPMTYGQAMLHHTRIRHLMEDSRVTKPQCPDLQWVTLDILFRRALLILHRRFAHQPCAPTMYSESYWTSLECSLALLAHQRELTDSKNQWFAGLFRQDFVTAAIALSLHLTQTRTSLEPPRGLLCSSTSERTAQTIVLQTLHSCCEIWNSARQRSVCQYESFRFLKEILEAVVPRDFDELAE